MASTMFLGKDLIGIPLVNTQSGRVLGHVKDIYLDNSLQMIEGFYLGSSGLLRRKHHFVSRANVQTIGEDTILLLSNEVMETSQDPTEDHPWLRRDDLQGRAVDTPGGTKIGAVDDTILQSSGAVIGFSLKSVFVEGSVAEKRAIRRTAVLDTGAEDGVMTVDLHRAEKQDLTIESTLFSSEKIVTADSENPQDKDTMTPYTETKPDEIYVHHEGASQTPYVKESQNAVDHTDEMYKSPYVTPEGESIQDKPYKSPYVTPHGIT